MYDFDVQRQMKKNSCWIKCFSSKKNRLPSAIRFRDSSFKVIFFIELQMGFYFFRHLYYSLSIISFIDFAPCFSFLN